VVVAGVERAIASLGRARRALRVGFADAPLSRRYERRGAACACGRRLLGVERLRGSAQAGRARRSTQAGLEAINVQPWGDHRIALYSAPAPRCFK